VDYLNGSILANSNHLAIIEDRSCCENMTVLKYRFWPVAAKLQPIHLFRIRNVRHREPITRLEKLLEEVVLVKGSKPPARASATARPHNLY